MKINRNDMFVARVTSYQVKHMGTSCTAHAVTADTNTRCSCDANLAFLQATTDAELDLGQV